MALETGNYINDLNITYPTSADPKSQGDDHLRLIKSILKKTINGFSGAVLLTATDTGTASAHVLTPSTVLPSYTPMLCLLYMPATTNTGAVTVNVSGLGAKSIKTLFGADPTSGDIVAGQPVLLMYNGTNFINLAGSEFLSKTGSQTLTGDLTLTGSQTISGTLDVTGNVTMPTQGVGNNTTKGATTEFVTKAVLDETTRAIAAENAETARAIATENAEYARATAAEALLAPIANPSLTGHPTAPTPDGTNSQQIANYAFVVATAFNAALPGQTGNAGKVITTDGTNAYWGSATASGLQTTTNPVIVSGATAPVAGQVLTALTPTTANWKDASIKKIVEKSVKSLIGVGTVTAIISSEWLDVDRVLLVLIGGSTEMYAVVYNRTTNVFGTPVLVRATNLFISATKVATDLVMIVSSDATTALEAVTLSISDTTITLNSGTKATATLAGNIAGGLGVQIVGSSHIIAYKRATTTTALRAITVSGTTPTIGAEVTLTATYNNTLTNIHYGGAGSVFRVVIDDTATTAKCIPVTVSGSTLTLGTSAQVTGAPYKTMLLSNGDVFLTYLSTNPYAAIFKLTGTVEAVTTVLLNSFTSLSWNLFDAIDCGGGKVALMANGVASGTDLIVLQDTAGTISKGTNINITTTASRSVTALTLNSNIASFALTMTNSNIVIKSDVSGSSPSLTSVVESEIPGDNITGGYLSSFMPSSSLFAKPKEIAVNTNGDLLEVSGDVCLSYYKNNGDSILRSENLPNAGSAVRAGYTNDEKILFTSSAKGAFRIQIVGFTV